MYLCIGKCILFRDTWLCSSAFRTFLCESFSCPVKVSSNNQSPKLGHTARVTMFQEIHRQRPTLSRSPFCPILTIILVPLPRSFKSATMRKIPHSVRISSYCEASCSLQHRYIRGYLPVCLTAPMAAVPSFSRLFNTRVKWSLEKFFADQ